jgi:hypothetical protein
MEILKKTDFEIISLERCFHLSIIDIEKDFINNYIIKWLES